MPAIDPQVLLEEAKCYACYANASLADLLKLALLNRIAQAGSGGGSQTPWTSDIDGGCFNLNNVCKTNGIGVYRALLSQSGTDDPVATVLENSLGGSVVWTRVGVGTFLATSSNLFTENKTFLSLSAADSVLIVNVEAFVQPGQQDGSNVYFANKAYDGSNVDDLGRAYIQILVYPATPQCPDCA